MNNTLNQEHGINTAIQQANGLTIPVNTDDSIEITDIPFKMDLVQSSCEYDDADQLFIDISGYSILELIKIIQTGLSSVAESREVLFSLRNTGTPKRSYWKIQPHGCGKMFLELLRSYVRQLPALATNQSYPPEVSAFLILLEKHQLVYLQRHHLDGFNLEMLQSICDCLNACVNDIRLELSSPYFETKRRKHTKASLKNQKGGFRWLDFLLEQHNRLCVIRLDLSYCKKYQWAEDGYSSVTMNECFEHRETFLRKLSTLIKNEALLGYMVKTEFTLKRSIHHHMLLIVNGSKLWNAIEIADILGKYWSTEMTQGRGSFHNCNQRIDMNSETSGIGDVYAHDAHKVKNLKERVIAYLCKPDYYVRWVVPQKHRLFLKSVAKPLNGKKRGRPRIRSEVFMQNYLNEPGWMPSIILH